MKNKKINQKTIYILIRLCWEDLSASLTENYIVCINQIIKITICGNFCGLSSLVHNDESQQDFFVCVLFHLLHPSAHSTRLLRAQQDKSTKGTTTKNRKLAATLVSINHPPQVNPGDGSEP